MGDLSAKRSAASAKRLSIIGLGLAIALSQTTCSAFNAGLGSKIDIEPPSVSILSPSSGDFVKGIITIKGKASDDTGVKSVVLALTNDQTQAAIGQPITANFDAKTGTWAAPLDVLSLVPSASSAEVPVSIVVTVTDIADPPHVTKTIPPLKLVFDDHAPTLALNYPDRSAMEAASNSSDHISLSGVVPFSGSAFDIGLKQVALTYTPYDSSGNRGASKTIVANGASSWSLDLDTTTLFPSSVGRVDLSFTATDSAYSDSDPNGNATTLDIDPKDSATSLYGVVIDQNASKPTFNSDNGNNLNLDLKAGLQPDPSAVYSLNPGITIPLTVEDINGLRTVDGQPYTWSGTSNLDVDVTVTQKMPQPDGSTVLGSAQSARTLGWLVPSSTIAPKTRVAPNGKTYVISADYRLSLPAATDGDFILGFTATNDHDAKAPVGNTDADETRLVDATITLDLVPPRATETNYGSALIQSNRDVSFAGIADDAAQTHYRKAKGAVLTYSKDGASPVTAAAATSASPSGFAWNLTNSAATAAQGFAWSYTLPASLGDGMYNLALAVTDYADKVSTVSRTVQIDTSAPVAVISNPQSLSSASSAYWLSGSTAGIGGTASDGGSGVAAVYYAAVAKGSAVPAFSTSSGIWTQAGGTLSWSGTLKLGGSGGLGEGEYTLYAAAVDGAGNVSPLVSRDFGVDLSQPNLAVTTPASDSSTYAAAGSDAFPGFAGNVWDSNALAGASSLTVYYTKNGVSAPVSTIAVVDSAHSAPGNSWTWTPFPSGIDATGHSNDGIYAFTFTATDVAGKTASVTRTVQIDTTAPALVATAPVANESTSSSSYTIQGTSTDTGGVGFPGTNAVEYSLDGGSTWTGLSLSGTSWSATVSLGTTEGAKTLKLRSTDKLGNQSSQTIGFFYDLNPPVMQETGVGGGTNPATYSTATRSTVHFAGSANDTDALASAHALTVSIDHAAAVDLFGLAAPYTASGTTGGWTVNVAVGSGGLADGPHDFVFTATDIAGKTTSVERAVTVDTTAPVSSIVTPPILSSLDTSYWLSGATAGIGGTSTDSGSGASGIVGLYYDIVAKGSAAPAFSTSTWTQAAGTTNWNGTVKLSGTGGTGEGQFTMYVAAVDAVGNVETAKTRDFGVDQNPPTATETHTATFAAKSLYTLAGTIADTNSLSTLAITEQKGSGTPMTVAFAAPASVGGTSQGWTSASLPLGKSQADLDAHAADGSYAYAITVTDVAGKSTTITRTVNIDTTAPTLSMSAIPSWISSSAYTIGGSATDPNAGASGVANIVYSLDGGTSWTSAGWSDSSGGANTSGTWTATLTGLAEGSHSLIVKAIDAAGNATTNAAVDFGVDLAAPSLGVGATPATITSSTASSFTGFGGTLSDSDPASVMGSTLGVTVSSTQNGNLVDNGSPITAGSNWTFGFAINATTHAQDGLWSFTFTATDVAGKTTVVTRSLTVDTQAPTITVTSPSANGWVSSSSLSVTGVANDGSGTGVNAVYAKVDNASIDHSSEDPTVSANGWTLMAGKTNWNTDATHALPVLAGEGNKTLWIKATDAAGNITTASEAISATNKIDFGYDAAAPNLAETTINTTSTVSTDAPPSFDGATWDSDPVGAATPLTVSYSKNGGTATSATINVVGTSTSSPGNLWSWTPFATLDTAGHTQDGQWSFVFTATDAAGKTTVVTRSIQIDTTAPTAAVNAIGGYVSGVIPISGSSSDAGAATSGVAKVQYQLGSTAGAWTDASGAGSWIGSLDLSASAEGTLALYVRAVDFAGNVGLPVSTTINIDKANPEATETTHGTALIQSNMNVAFAGQADDAAVTSGRQASSAVLSYSKNGGAAVTLTGADGFNWNQSTGAWTYSLPTSLGDGLYALTLLVSDAAGKTASVTRTVQIDTTAPALVATAPVANESTSSSSYTIQGTSTDTGGVGFPGTNAVEYSLDGGSTWTGLSLSGTSWSATVSLGTTEGAKTLKLRSTDKLGNQSSQTIGFFYDLNPPVMQETGVGGGTNPATYSTATRGTIHFAGKVEDTDALAASGAFQVSIDHGAAVDVGSLGAGYAYATVATAQGFTWTLDVTVGAGGLADGTHDFTFTAKDIAGKTISVDRVEQVDTTAPSSAIVTPTAGLTSADAAYWLSGTTASINGTSGDTGSGATGVTGVYYKVVTKGSAAPTFSTASWTQAGGTSNWNGTLTLSGSGGIGEGEYALYVAAMDAVGNVETAKTRDFGVDQNPPTVTETHAALSSTKTTFTLTGTVGDTNALATMSITESMNGGMAQAVGFTPSVALAGVKTASFTSASLPLGGVVDGSYAYVITGTDAAGKTTTVNRTITIDTTAPTVNLNAVPAWVSSSAYTISGSATDPNPGSGASGVATIQYSLDGGTSWANAAWTDTSGTNVAGTWTATMTALVEGPHSLLVKATDAAGNAVTNGAVNFGVDYNPPNLSVTAPPATVTAATASAFAGIGGYAWDSYQLASSSSLTVIYTKNGGTGMTATITVADASHVAPGNVWTWTPFSGGIDAATHANDGIYSFTFTATDAAGKVTQSGPYSMTVDTMSPQLTVTSPATATPMTWVSNSTLNVTGVANDGSGSGVQSVYVLVDDPYAVSTSTDHGADDPTATGSPWTKAAGTVSFSASLTLSSEGAKTLWVKAVDNYGNWTTNAEALSAKVGFGYDKTAPSLVSTDATPSTVNTVFTLGGNVSDAASGLASLVVSADGATPATAVSVGSGSWSYPVTVLPSDGAHGYLFTATDNAGNVRTMTRTITVDTKAPVVTFSNIDPTKNTASTAITLVDSLPKVMGTITDETGIGTVQSMVEFSADNGSTWATTQSWTSLSTSGSTPLSVSFAKDLSAAPFLTDGLYRITLSAADTLATPNSGNSATVWFRLDRNNPIVSSLLSSAGSAAVNSNFTLSGNASSNNLSVVEYRFDSGSYTTMSGVTPGTYGFSTGLGNAISVAASTMAEGSHTVTVQALSSGQRVGSQTYSFLVDKTAPAPSMTTPAPGAAISGNSVILGGGATDLGGGGTPAGVSGVDWQLARGISLTLTGSTFSTSAAHGLAAGDIVYFSAYAGGNLPSGISANQPYWVSLTGLTTTAFEVSATNGGAVLNPGTGGTVFFAAKVGTWTAATYGSSIWNATLDSTSLSEGSYLLLSRATDLAGNVSAAIASRLMVDQNAPALDFSTTAASGIFSSAFVASGLSSDPSDTSDPAATNGVASVILSIDDPTFNTSHVGTVAIDLTKTTAWSYDLASAPSSFFSGLSGVPTNFASISEGSHYLYARATDKAGRTFDKAFAFIKDTVAPAPSFTNLSTSTPWTVYLQTGTKIAGTIADANGVASATYEVEQYTAGAWTIKQATTSLGSTANSTNFPWTVDLSGYADGHYRLTLNALDRAAPSANAMAPQVCEFYLDTAAPTAGIANPAIGRIASTDIGAPTGAAADANLTSATIQLDSIPAVDVYASAGAWTYPAWNWAGLVDGTHTLTLTATDIAGKTTTTTRTFVKDTSAPAVSYNNIATSGAGYPTVISTSATPSLSGTLTDASGIASYSYTLSAYNPASASWNPMIASSSTIVTGSPVTYNWSIPLSTLGLPDGKYQVTVSAIDVASPANGTASPTQVQFFISNASPAAALNSPALGSWVSASFTLTGTAQDSSGVTGLSVMATSASSPTFGASNALPAFAIISVGTATATFQTSLPHGLGVGDSVYIAGSAMPTTSTGTLTSTSTYTIASVSASSATSGIDEFTLTGVSSLTGSGSGLSVAKSGAAFGASVAPPLASLSLAAGTGVSTSSALFADGNVVYFTGSLPSSTPAISAGTPYYVQSVSGSTFVLSTAASGGTILNYASAGSATVYSPSLNLGWLLPNISLAGVGNGAFTAYAQVTSADGKTSVASRSYSLDNQPPTVAMSSPSTTSVLAAASPTGSAITVGASGSPLQGLVSIAGTTSDPGSGVSQNIQYYIGKSGSYQSGSSASNWVLSLGDISGYANSTNAYACDLNGQTLLALDYWLIPIHFQAVDNAGNSVQVTDYFVYNSNANTPTISISSPANAQTFGGQQRIYGTATQPVGVYGAEVYVDPTNGSTPPTTISTSVLTSSTTFTLSSALASPLAANTVVYIKSVAQIPSLPGGATAGKAYYIVGATSTTTSFQVATSSGGGAIGFTSGVGTTYAVDQWAPATLMTSGTSVSWYYDINVGNIYPQSGQSSQTVSVTGRAWSATSFGGPRGNFTGYMASPLTMTFNNTFPTVTMSSITPQGGSAQAYTQSMDARGTFTLGGSVSTPVGLSSLNLVDTGPFSGTSALYAITASGGTVTAIPLSASGTSGNGYTYAVSAQNQLGSGAAVTYASGQAYKLLIVNPGSNTTPGTNPWVALGLGGTITPAIGMTFTVSAAGTIPTGAQAIESDSSGKFQYSIAMTINSSTVYPSLTTGGYYSGALGFNLQAADLTTPTAQVTTSPAGVSVDNFAPVAAAPTGLSTVTDSSSNSYGVLAGAAQTIASSVTDIGTSSGTVGGIKDVYVYLLDSSGNVVPLAGGASIAAGTYTYVDYQGNTQSWPSTSTSGYYLDIATTTSGAYVASGIAGVTEMMGLSGSNTTWGIQLDTTKFADGPYTLAYTVFDIAGNATHATSRVFVGNSGPKFSGVTLGTSIGGSIVTQAYTSSALPNTGFIAEGNTLSFNVSSLYGNGTTTPNGALSYTLTYNGSNYWSQGTVTGVSSNGATVTFNPTAVTPAIADTSTSNGASFVLTVTDQTATIPQSYSTTIAMNIQNADHGTPAIGVAPFGTQYLLPTTNPYTTGNVFQTGPVSSYGQNIGSNGGHIDYTSPYTSGAAAVSGQVIFLGSAWNDQALTKITVTIPGYNGGAEFNIATYSGGTWAPLSGTGWSVAIDTSHQVLGLSGQQVNWTFTWDSSSLSTVTGKNITVTFKAYNANPNVAQYSASATSLVDVVPYISKISTQAQMSTGGVKDINIRGADGSYSIPTGTNATFITVTGYNLAPITNGVRISNTTYKSGINGTTLMGNSVAFAAASPWTTLYVSQNTTASGWLGVVGGTALAPIPATNNINDNLQTYDQEPDLVYTHNPKLTDDRYLRFFTVSSTGIANGYYANMLMVGGSPYFGYIQSGANGDLQVQRGASSGSYVPLIRALAADQMSMAVDAGGKYHVVSVNNFNQGRMEYMYDTYASNYTGGNGVDSYSNNGASSPYWSGYTGNFSSAVGNNALDLDSVNYTPGLQLGRYVSPTIQVSGNSVTSYATVCLAVYDQYAGAIIFRDWQVGASPSGGTTYNLGSGKSTLSDISSTSGDGTRQSVVTNANGASQYFAMGITDQGYVVIVFYNQNTSQLNLIYSATASGGMTPAAVTGANPSTTINWSSPLVINQPYTGTYLSLYIQSDGSAATPDPIHIAAFDSSGADLRYIYLTSLTDTSPKIALVDATNSVGIYTDVTVYNGTPWISYYNNSENGTHDSLKMAYFKGTLPTVTDGVDSSGNTTGNWEYLTVPSGSIPQGGVTKFLRTNIGFDGSGNPLVGYTGAAGIEYSKMNAAVP